MKRYIRLVCMLLVFATLVAVPAHAQEQEPRASQYIAAYRAYCTRTSTTTLAVSFQIIGMDDMDEIGANMIKVQYSSDQVNWTTAKTFYKSVYTGMVDSNTGMHAAVLECVIPAGKYYRAYIEFYAEKDGGFAERYYYTAII